MHVGIDKCEMLALSLLAYKRNLQKLACFEANANNKKSFNSQGLINFNMLVLTNLITLNLKLMEAI